MTQKLVFYVAAALLVLTLAPVGTAQPQAVITVEAFSPQVLKDLGWTSRPSNGLSVVGRGELVYLAGTDASGGEVTSYTWSLPNLPIGSSATMDSTNTRLTTFVPDAKGQYLVKLEITTSAGTSETTYVITCGTYVGVGTIGGATPSLAEGQCGACHQTAVSGWQTTGHATKLMRDLSGQTSDHFAEHCLPCHTVGFDAEANNEGFADIAERDGWTFPDTLAPASWDALVTNFPDVAARTNIQCENCHGPGSEHRGQLEKTQVSLDEGVCGKCHESEPYHVKNLQWKKSGHAIGVASGAGRQPCAQCHSGYGFIARIDDEVDMGHTVTTGFPQISCAVCHDPHSTNHPQQLRRVSDVTLNNGEVFTFGGRGTFCMSCHISRQNADTYVQEYQNHFGPHHSTQGDMLAGTNVATFGKQINSGFHRFVIEDLCISCHMAPTPGNGQPGHNAVGEHTFAMHDPETGADNVSACLPCHEISSFDEFPATTDHDGDGKTETARQELQGLMDAVGRRLPPFGSPEVVVDTTQFPIETYTPLVLQAAYNHIFITDDGSRGMHNYDFSINLMKVTLDTLNKTTVGVKDLDDFGGGVPKVFALHANYPNPFNPSTKIAFDVPKASHVKLVIYNSIGQQIETIFDEEASPKSYEVEWVASNLSSGVYFYILRADNFVQTRKMLLLK